MLPLMSNDNKLLTLDGDKAECLSKQFNYVLAEEAIHLIVIHP